MLEYRWVMGFRSAWTGLLLLVVMAVACFGPACGVACAAKVPCHDAAMADCDGMIPVSAAMHHVATCAQDDAVVVDRSDFDVHRFVTTPVAYSVSGLSAVGHEIVVKAVRGLAKAPPRLASVMRV